VRPVAGLVQSQLPDPGIDDPRVLLDTRSMDGLGVTVPLNAV
jgi:hypothetical protein